ncbi:MULTISPECIES: hypothetical protein [Ralstonia]|uniref:Transposase n=1 Tax=Ralstonia holmesii TaxID=3058602 RepID=A0ABC8QBA3_9RALS|nr:MULTISPECIES: hypothetical protein [unclassified Ralstonia]CAJ0788063.1 hypothetical protein LMG18096_02054 [Ralstonia sp. LMG 32967]CAJ0808777.1 hypothetical protein LMG18093_00560 [Ralstonia sp. LMG 32967]
MEAMKNTGHQRGSKIIYMWKTAPAYLMLNGLARGCESTECYCST